MATPLPPQVPQGRYSPPTMKRKWPWVIAAGVAFVVAVSALSNGDKKTDASALSTAAAGQTHARGSAVPAHRCRGGSKAASQMRSPG